jgi:hypothetical protein
MYYQMSLPGMWGLRALAALQLLAAAGGSADPLNPLTLLGEADDGSVAALARVQAIAHGGKVATNPGHPYKASRLPLPELLKREHGAFDRDHPQEYEDLAAGAPWRRRAQAGEEMTDDNTRQLKINVDFASFYPAKATPHAGCFAVGDWFKWNFPSPNPPCPGEHCP